MIGRNTKVQGTGRFFQMVSMLVVVIAMLAFSASNLEAQARTINIEADGLPAGLNVSFALEFARCTANGMTFVAAGSVTLDEHSWTTYEPVTLPNGLPSLRAVVHTEYLGQLSVFLPANNGCQSVPNNTARSFYGILGESNGAQAFRRTNPVGRILSSPTMNIAETISAFTRVIVDSNAQAPAASIARSTTANSRWAVGYDDHFGAASISSPSLSITQLVVGFGGMLTTQTRIKMILNTAGQVCLTVDGATVCRARSQGGTLVNGAVSVNVGQLQDTNNQIERSVLWVFRIDPTFPAGNFNAVAGASDDDPMEYLVDGSPEPLNLLPWKNMVIPITIN